MLARLFILCALGAAALFSFFQVDFAENMNFIEAQAYLLTGEELGYWDGYAHGLLALFAGIAKFFDYDVAIYAIYQQSGWYDFGYISGVMSVGGALFGGSSDDEE